MEGTIKVEPSKLISTASEFQTAGNQIKNLTTQMTSLVTGLSGSVWSGDAANAYVKKFRGLQDDIQRMIKMVNEHASDLQEMARTYTKAEDANVSEAGSLTEDVIV